MDRADFLDIPANRYFGFSLVSRSDDRAEVTLPLKKEYLQEGGVVHGGIISSLADTTAVYVIYPSLPGNQTMTSIEFKINFLAAAVLEKGELRAVARRVKRGRTIALCDVEVWQQETLVAKGLFTYMILEKG